jgi:hypothetical protein
MIAATESTTVTQTRAAEAARRGRRVPVGERAAVGDPFRPRDGIPRKIITLR